VLVATKIPI